MPALVHRLLVALLASGAHPLSAQTGGLRPPPAAELTAGYAGFVDDATIDHAVIGAGVRIHLLPRVSVGREIQYMNGPGTDGALILTGNTTCDVLPPHRRVTPSIVAGGGLFRHSNSFGIGASRRLKERSRPEAAFGRG